MANGRSIRIGLAILAAVLTVVGLMLPWWPDDFYDRGATEGFDIMADNDWRIISWYGAGGYVLHVVLALAAPVLAAFRGRRRFVVVVPALAGIWQLIAIRGATLINTTTAPWWGFVGALVLLGAAVIPDDPND